MATFQKKTHLITVEAVQFAKGVTVDVGPALESIGEQSDVMWCPTKHGGARVKVGDWVVTAPVQKLVTPQPEGAIEPVYETVYEHTVVSDVDFHKTYDAAGAAPEAMEEIKAKPKRVSAKATEE